MGVRIDPLTMAETVAATEKFVRDKKPLHLMGVNADKLNQCATDEAIKKIVNESEIINADGASVVLAARYLGYSVPERVAGIDLMQELLHLANEKGYSVYFFGAKEEVLTDMLTIFKKDYIKRAPMWMQKANLEWLFRVANEPKRLFKRYFVGNATFIKRVVHEKRKAKK